MKFLNLLFFSWFLQPCVAVQPKLCIHCKHFTKTFMNRNEFGKCLLFPRKIEDDDYYVTGKITKIKPDYYYCTTARTQTNMCDKQGKFYEKN